MSSPIKRPQGRPPPVDMGEEARLRNIICDIRDVVYHKDNISYENILKLIRDIIFQGGFRDV